MTVDPSHHFWAVGILIQIIYLSVVPCGACCHVPVLKSVLQLLCRI